MNQRELTLAIAKRFFLTKTESEEIIKFTLEEITKSLKEGERVYFRNFGSFTKKKRKAKRVRNPNTGKLITIPERITVDFNPSELLVQTLKNTNDYI